MKFDRIEIAIARTLFLSHNLNIIQVQPIRSNVNEMLMKFRDLDQLQGK